MIDIEKLKAVALTSTQGEWETKYSLHYGNCHIASSKGRGICLTQQDKDAYYIAIANPAAILALIERLEITEEKLTVARQNLSDILKKHDLLNEQVKSPEVDAANW